ncbi:interferon lambda-4-like [Phyllostomus discolor]|uniref:Interferon lambda-4-like n=1 Tax=Phyllostomus discolor TaxID=89673 RepID=A0A6J2N1P8_9CHIR|nr:interferon lambda-4-like [Phyllostomus discolor]
MEGASPTGEGGHYSGGLPGERAEMRPCGVAAVFMGLWAFVTLSVAADGGVAEPRRCLLSHYRWLDPRALVSIKALRDHYEQEMLSWRPRNCSFRPRRDPPRPLTCARLRLVARDLSDAQAVLSSLPSPELFPGVIPTLELLAAARRDVVACLELVRPGFSRKSLRPPRRRPKTRRADSPRCHEASVIFNLLRLLTWDLKLVAHSGPCL